MNNDHHLTHREMSRLLMAVEIVGFSLVLLFLWLDELLDLPRILFHGPVTPINWHESIFESLIVLVLGALVVTLTRGLLKRIRYLEGFHRVCASCHRIQAGNEWVQFEVWVHDGSEADFSHGLCPECGERFQRELDTVV
ncbi:MAG: hypothetical protein V2A56_02025 [bacterium]